MKKGDQVVLSFTGIVTEVFSSQGYIDIIQIETEQGISHTFWPAEESSVTINVLAKEGK
jgi:hypothetical protein